ncbi:hypothetical protein [Deinococcus sp. Leaf326]|uniref:hypothetical protein n=1 Tax=Deinococcus sp. Leaf326 TaxID=1736338 RepID=UPI0006F81225|nr:hypothetical protein [Deinococcus sp. Leaf326]KQR33139.1 hypothetical protein ASF71_16750 [Deinococcus sp. Leaf326]
MTTVLFMFDDGSFGALSQMTTEGNYADPADTLRESLQINATFMTQAKQGFTEVIVRNPRTGDERTLEIPRLSLIAARCRL